jgi:hypothetical protein
MRMSTRLGTALAGAAWIVLGVVMISFARSPDAADACHSDALWSGGWFFAPPLLALIGLGLTLRRLPRRAIGLGANALLLTLWTLAALPLWALVAVAQGASCGGG